MKYILAGVLAASVFVPGLATSQVAIDMSRVTCADYLALPQADAKMFGAWVSGWFSQKHGYGFIDLDTHATNVANMTKWCTSNPNAKIMAALEQFT